MRERVPRFVPIRMQPSNISGIALDTRLKSDGATLNSLRPPMGYIRALSTILSESTDISSVALVSCASSGSPILNPLTTISLSHARLRVKSGR